MRASLAILVLVVWVGSAAAGDSGRSFEVTFADTAVSYADDPDWGWWTAAKYDEWRPVERDKRQLAGARFTVDRERYSAFLAYERYPTLEAFASEVDAVTGERTAHELATELETYDLGVGQTYELAGGAGLMPWVSLTHLRVDERRTSQPDPPAGSPLPVQTAGSHLWGVGVGLEGSLPLWGRLGVAARVAWRWAQGDRKSRLPSEVTGTGEPEVTWVELSDSTTRTLYGGEASLTWNPSGVLWLEGGWSYRNFERGGGPASFHGPFLRLGVAW